MEEDEKSLGQLEYEEYKYKQFVNHSRICADWEALTPEEQGEWNLLAAIFGRKRE